MAAKVPTTLTKQNWGSVNVLMANFDGTVASNDIDDNDTWASGVKLGKIVGYIVQSTIDGPQDCTIDAIDADGVCTFGSAANQTAVVYLMYKDI